MSETFFFLLFYTFPSKDLLISKPDFPSILQGGPVVNFGLILTITYTVLRPPIFGFIFRGVFRARSFFLHFCWFFFFVVFPLLPYARQWFSREKNAPSRRRVDKYFIGIINFPADLLR